MCTLCICTEISIFTVVDLTLPYASKPVYKHTRGGQGAVWQSCMTANHWGMVLLRQWCDEQTCRCFELTVLYPLVILNTLFFKYPIGLPVILIINWCISVCLMLLSVFKGIICCISALKHLKVVLISCVFRVFQMILTVFKPREIWNSIQTEPFHLVRKHQRVRKKVSKQD